METNGKRKANFLFLTMLPLNNAIAIWGAKPGTLPGMILYKEAIARSKTKLPTIDLSIFMLYLLSRQN